VLFRSQEIKDASPILHTVLSAEYLHSSTLLLTE
jgi:hypothetical protein